MFRLISTALVSGFILDPLSGYGHFAGRLSRPIITAFFELERQFLSTTAHNASRDHNMHVVWHDVIQKSLVMRNQKHPQTGSTHHVDAARDNLERVNIE